MNWTCPDCGDRLEIIKACGCQDYFCNTCNQLVSKRRAIDTDAQTTEPSSEKKDAKASEETH